MRGGYGKLDIYRSDFINGTWSKPQNLGENINTSQDEKYPFPKDNILYFASDGHPGIGGLDIFKVNLSDEIQEVVNMGYPVNSIADDFSLFLDNSGSFGYLSSNRNQNYDNDNIYALHINKPRYPLLISGIIRYKNTTIEDSDVEIMPLCYAELELIELTQQAIIKKSTSDESGHFSLEIPFEGQFKLRVRHQDIGISIVSMEIPKNPKDYLNYEIIVVKELFKSSMKEDDGYSSKHIEEITSLDR
jgi:hypothetical protein